MNLSLGASPTRDAIPADPSLDAQGRALMLALLHEEQLASKGRAQAGAR